MPLSPSRMSIAVLASCIFAALAFAGYEYPLKSPEIRNAFFLGQRPDNTPDEFLSAYKHRFPNQQGGEYIVNEIDALTPYAQVVQRAAKNTPGDSEVQMETDLRAHPLRFLVKVMVVYSSAYAGPKAGMAFMQDSGGSFSIQAEQKDKLKSLAMNAAPFTGGEDAPSGVVLTAEFDPTKITSGPMHITVRTPDGRSASADFDLSKLK